jgi:undecaprenyl-diphosphatase
MADVLELTRWLRRWVRSERLRPLIKPLCAGFAAAAFGWAFIALSAEMVEGDTLGLDMVVLRAAHTLRLAQPWVTDVLRDISSLGGTAVLTLFTVITVGYLAIASTRAMAMLVAGAVISGSVSVGLLKTAFGRPRPDSSFAEMVAPGLSFPSGHAGMSAIVFLTLGALLASTRERAVEQVYILAMASCMTLLVGLSRVALGVHFATDVLAGWAFGSAWALLWLLLASRLTLPAAAATNAGRIAPP